jgi:hypothetical protein
VYRWCDPPERGRICEMKIDLLFDPFGVTWRDVREGAISAEGEGFDGVWLYDHLAGRCIAKIASSSPGRR